MTAHPYADASAIVATSFLFLLLLLLRPPPASPRPLVEQDTATWHVFSRLMEVENGSHVAGLKRYLHRFGYMAPPPGGNYTDVFDAPLQTAISLYQSNLGLAVTGRLDAATASQLSLPRCGVPDHRAPRSVSRFAFFPGRPTWDRPKPFTLTYAFSGKHTLEYLDAAAVRSAFQRSFARWSDVIPVNFAETSDYKSADVRIGFYRGEHGDGEPFDGVLGVLAHAFSPESGRLHLDASETWSLNFLVETSPTAVDLESVATHEIGHVLGLGHTSVKEAVMYPSVKPRTRKVRLMLDDVEGAQALYGSNPNFRFSSLSQSDTSATAILPPRRGAAIGIVAIIATMLIA